MAKKPKRTSERKRAERHTTPVGKPTRRVTTVAQSGVPKPTDTLAQPAEAQPGREPGQRIADWFAKIRSQLRTPVEEWVPEERKPAVASPAELMTLVGMAVVGLVEAGLAVMRAANGAGR
ncbi:hypothetical protein [Nitrospira sp. Kam-Ns4a]